tara:strand:+ start:527 stop:703 length:177 start_codon:yes stop_codon:yes gene_type:complete
MIAFRAQPPQGDEWDHISFSGDNEELLSHLFIAMITDAGWETLISQDGGDFTPLDEIS